MRRDVHVRPRLSCKAASESWKTVSPSLNIGRRATVRLEIKRQRVSASKAKFLYAKVD